MGKGGARPGAGRKPDPNSARQRKLAERAGNLARGFTEPGGGKSANAPSGWPFGTAPAPTPALAADQSPTAPPDPGASPITAVALLQRVYRDECEDLKVRLQAAALAAPFESPKMAPVHKKEPKPEKTAAPSRFAAKAPPKLVVNNKG
jgi:phage terminase small subunit